MSSAARSSIEVAIRVRPARPEIGETKGAWEITTSTARELANPDTFFTFDHIYGTDVETAQLYQRSVREPIVSRVAQGYNGTVFAYGQTGSGKTFTMFGSEYGERPGATSSSSSGGGGGGSRRSRAGLIELAVRDLFAQLDQQVGAELGESRDPLRPGNGSGQVVRYEVFLSELEIYNEQLRDLLLEPGQQPKPLSIRENAHGVYVHNAVRQRVRTAAECLSEIYRHAAARVSAATAMNERSSRSHCIIQLHVEKMVWLDGDSGDDDDDDDGGSEGAAATGTEDDTATDVASLTSHTATTTNGGRGRRGAPGGGSSRPDKKKLVSQLNMVDLAGSERVAKTGAVGQRMVEGGHINKSLTTLTTVINRLAESRSGGRGGGAFVPYRDSRLTHLLRTSIGGNAFTCILCCVTPAIENVDESRSTLHFASRAKKIENRVMINEVMDPKARVRELEGKLRQTRRQLVAQTIYLWSKQVTIRHLQRQIESLLGEDGAAADEASSHARRRAGPGAQRGLIMEQLQAQNEALEEELERLRRTERITTDAPAARELEEERRRCASLEQEVADLNAFCDELQADNEKQTVQVKQMEASVKEVEGLLDDLEDERDAAVAETELLRTQLQKTQTKLLEKSRGDAYLEELTQLHITHQELQFHHAQLTETSQKQIKDLQTRLEAAKHSQEDLEDEVGEAKDHAKRLNAFLWRFLAVASLASKGRVDTDGSGAAAARADRPVPDAQIAAALDTLTKRIGSSIDPHLPSEEDSRTRGGTSSKREVASLQAKIRELEAKLLNKDAQRDVLVDTKLKRMQDLVLRLHAINNALIDEMRQCHSEYNDLYDMAKKHTKLASKIIQSGLGPRSFEGALDRARFAEGASKPFGHN